MAARTDGGGGTTRPRSTRPIPIVGRVPTPVSPRNPTGNYRPPSSRPTNVQQPNIPNDPNAAYKAQLERIQKNASQWAELIVNQPQGRTVDKPIKTKPWLAVKGSEEAGYYQRQAGLANYVANRGAINTYNSKFKDSAKKAREILASEADAARERGDMRTYNQYMRMADPVLMSDAEVATLLGLGTSNTLKTQVGTKKKPKNLAAKVAAGGAKLLGKAAGAIDDATFGGLSRGLNAYNWTMEQVTAPTRTFAYARQNRLGFFDAWGEGVREAIPTALGGGGGLGEDINTHEERQRLREEGFFVNGKRVYLQSPGEFAADAIPKVPESWTDKGSHGKVNVLTGTLDLGYQVGTDPMTYVSAGLGSVAKNTVGRAANSALREAALKKAATFSTQGLIDTFGTTNVRRLSTRALVESLGDDFIKGMAEARYTWLTGTRLGKAFDDQVANHLRRIATHPGANADQTAAISKAFGLSDDVAARAAAALEDEGVDAAREIIRQALASGEMNLRINVRRQVAAKLGLERAAAGRSVPMLTGPSPIKGGGSFRAMLDRLARGTEAMYYGDRKVVAKVARAALHNAARLTDQGTWADFHARVVAPILGGGSIESQWEVLYNYAQSHPQLMAVVEESLTRLHKAVDLGGQVDNIGKLRSGRHYLTGVLNDPRALLELKRLQALFAMVEGKGGRAAASEATRLLGLLQADPLDAAKLLGQVNQNLARGKKMGVNRLWTEGPKKERRLLKTQGPEAKGQLTLPMDLPEGVKPPTVPTMSFVQGPNGRWYWEVNVDEALKQGQAEQVLDLAAEGSAQLSFDDYVQMVADEAELQEVLRLGMTRHLTPANISAHFTEMRDQLAVAVGRGDFNRAASILHNLEEVAKVLAQRWPEGIPATVPDFQTWKTFTTTIGRLVKSDLGVNSQHEYFDVYAYSVLESDDLLREAYGDYIEQLISHGVVVHASTLKGFPALQDRARELKNAIRQARIDERKALKEAAQLKKGEALLRKWEKRGDPLERLLLKIQGIEKKYTEKVVEGIRKDAAAHAKFIEKTFDDAVKRIEKAVKAKMDLNEARGTYGPSVLYATVDSLPLDLQPVFRKAVDDALANPKSNIQVLYEKMRRLSNDPIALEEARRINAAFSIPAAQALEGRNIMKAILAAPVKGGARIVGAAAEMMLAIAESIPPSMLATGDVDDNLLRAQQRQGIDRLLQGLRANGATRRHVLNLVNKAKTEDDLKQIVEAIYSEYAIAAGVNPDVVVKPLLQMQERRLNNVRKTMAKVVDGKVVTDDEAYTVAQRTTFIPLIEPADFQRAIRRAQIEAVRENALFTRADRVVGYARKPLVYTEYQLGRVNKLPGHVASSLLRKSGDEAIELTITEMAQRAHQFWKFAVVTNLPTAMVGAYAGWTYGYDKSDGNIWESALWAFGGAALGASASLRYVLRVAGVEERLIRYTLMRGLRPWEWIPGLSKYFAERGLQHKFGAYNSVRAFTSTSPLDYISKWKRAVTLSDSTWVAVSQADRRYIDAYSRIIHWQWHIESDVLAKTITEHMAGVISREQADNFIAAWLKTEQGELWYRRMKGSTATIKNPAEAVARYWEFADTYLNREVAAARLNAAMQGGMVSRAEIKRLMKEGVLPDVVHAQNIWHVPRPSHIFRDLTGITGQMVLSTPSSVMNRQPLARWIYRDEYLDLVRAGVDPERAATIATQRAVSRTNAVMFRISDESRFAKKFDLVFPFQQPREEMIRVYARLFMDNKAQTAQAARLAALAFNNGKEMGLFQKDPFTGMWYMKIPGTGVLSNFLFGEDAKNFEFRFALNSLFFFNQGAYGMSFLPVPGGPIAGTLMTLMLRDNPSWYQNLSPALKELIFPYGPMTTYLRPESRWLLYGLTGKHAPWELLAKDQLENEISKTELLVAKTLKWQNDQKGGDPNYIPTYEEVQKATRQMFLMKAMMGAWVPASSRPVVPYKDTIDQMVAMYTDSSGTVNWARLFDENPGADMYFTSSKEYVGPDTFEAWLNNYQVDWEMENLTGDVKYKGYEAYSADIREARRIDQAWQDYNLIRQIPGAAERSAAYARWEKDHPDIAAGRDAKYFATKELWDILYRTPAFMREEMVDDLRKRYKLSHKQYLKLAEEAKSFKIDPWVEARDKEDVYWQVQKDLKGQWNNYRLEQATVRALPPAEQVHYWNVAAANLFFEDSPEGEMDPEEVLRRYNDIRANKALIYQENPWLAESLSEADAEDAVVEKVTRQQELLMDEWRGDQGRINSQIAYAYKVKDAIQDQLDAAWDYAKRTKKYDEVNRLSDAQRKVNAQLKALYATLREAKNATYKKFPDLAAATEEMLAVLAPFKDASNSRAKALERVIALNAGGIPFLPSGEQAYFDRMPDAVRQAYITDLLGDLTAGPGMEGKQYWSYLTNFQKDLVRWNAPDIVAELEYEDRLHTGIEDQRIAIEEKMQAAAKAKNWKTYYALKDQMNKLKAASPVGVDAQVQWALKTLAKYGGGRPVPKGLKNYLRLAPNSVTRAQYLDPKGRFYDPELADYIKNGPWAKMPNHIKYQVKDILTGVLEWQVRTGMDNLLEGDTGETTKSGGSSRRSGGKRYSYRRYRSNPEISFAYEMLRRYNMRAGMSKPPTYDLWLNMPSGEAKAQYLRDHPEIRDWLKRGPMANMPEAYREVIRDIMFRYGKWTEKTDPLSVTIRNYYQTPGYAREQYLIEHPELLEYWKASRTPEEQAMYDKADQYYALTDTNARRMYLAANPDLQQWFIDRRTARYERFLAQVASFMGQNPMMFQAYLERQEDILNELLHRFGEWVQMQEMPKLPPEEAVKAKKSRNRG